MIAMKRKIMSLADSDVPPATLLSPAELNMIGLPRAHRNRVHRNQEGWAMCMWNLPLKAPRKFPAVSSPLLSGIL